MALTPNNYSLLPTQSKTLSTTNYIDFTSGAGNDFSQQYLPEIYEAEAERYGNRTVSGFLRMVGAEMPMTSDQVVWSEQNRLHIAYRDSATANQEVTMNTTAALGIITLGTDLTNVIRIGNTVLIEDATTNATAKAYVTNVSGQSFSCYNYAGTSWTGFGGTTADDVNVFVYGSEFIKGSGAMSGSVYPSFTQYSNKPIIIKDFYEVTGSDASQIGWVEVTDESGTSGYLWYLKGEGEARLRYQDYLEMAVVEGETANNTNLASINIEGTEGLFAAVESRGNVMSGFTAASGLNDFDEILQRLDKEGSIEENMLFLNRSVALDFDDMLAATNSYGSPGGTSYGVFENSEDMALNLGFSGFRRGSYDFYKTDWKYLNDASTRGMITDIEGVLVPAGTSTVYDQMLGTNIRRPFLHVRYRASETDDRRIKTWLTGSVGGVYTSGDDLMQVNFLSERCLVTQAANNFVLFKA
jgi:hypothetical protein